MLKSMKFMGLCLLLSACTGDGLTIKVSDEVISSDYIGNGAEWDPYDESVAWGVQLSDKDWDVLFDRLDVMGMGYVRCMINSPFLYWDAAAGTYDRTRNIENLVKLLSYCQNNGTTVVFGEFNPPAPEMKDSQKWVEMSVDYLNYLVNDLGFTCIKHFVIFNEPDGDWAPVNGDYQLWLSMARRFDAEMSKYPGLKDKVSIAAPDAVVHWIHPETGVDCSQWMKAVAENADDIVGIYDVHAYPGQTEVRNGSYAEKLRNLRSLVPQGKKIILGEAGFKYDKPGDEALLAENTRRAEAHRYAGAADSNMMVYEHFYGIDMALLAMDVMNSGFSGMAVWMLDDGAHSVGDTGVPQNIKVWGFWNILGKELFDAPHEEEIRPWYYAWSLMCRYFPKGCDILATSHDAVKGLRTCAAKAVGRGSSISIVNWSSKTYKSTVELPFDMNDARLYVYRDGGFSCDDDGMISALRTGLSGRRVDIEVPAESLVVLTDMK